MTDAAYAPGPWYYDNNGSIRQEATDAIVGCISDGGHITGKTIFSEETQAANGRLIAAAPELLTAAQLVIERWSNGDLADAVRQLDGIVGALSGEG